MRKAIPAKMRLQVTLRYFSSGANYRVLEELFRIPYSTISVIVKETAEAMWKVMQPQYLLTPSSEQEWLEIAYGFATKWNYPFALGAIDGKHCVVQAFNNTGSLFHNYKGNFSLVVMAIWDADLKFLYVDIGHPGSRIDAGVWADSTMNTLLKNEALHLPQTPPGAIKYHFVADDAFPLINRISNHDKLKESYKTLKARVKELEGSLEGEKLVAQVLEKKSFADAVRGGKNIKEGKVITIDDICQMENRKNNIIVRDQRSRMWR